MDRSRLVTALALAFTLLGVILGLVDIGLSRSSGGFVSETESFFTSARAGVALIEVRGVIADGYGPGGADRIADQIESAQKDPAVRGVLLSINSPGGAPGATKKIYDRIIELRKTKYVAAIITDVAASGGYYIASAADRIYAYPGSIVGSIGVISLHPNFGPFLARYGIEVEALKAGRYKDSSYPFRNLTEDERAMYQGVLDAAYQQFLNDVAEGRKTSLANVRNWAEGRIYSGTQARAEQMIDELGGRDQAMDAIRQALKLNETPPLLKPRRDFLEDFLENSPLGSRYQARNDYGALLSMPALYLYPAASNVALEAALSARGALDNQLR